jgi:gamma-glutamyltranspeptidase
VHLEGGWAPDVARQLAAAGWDVVEWSGGNLFFGGAAAVERRPDGGLAAAGDPRRGGHGMVVA